MTIALLLVACIAGAAVTTVLGQHGGSGGARHAGKSAADDMWRGGDPVVTARFKPDGTTLQSCGELSQADGKLPCWAQAFGNLTYQQGARVSLAALDARQQADPHMRSICHLVTHRIGAAEYARAHGNVTGNELAEGSTICSSGYYHGLLRESFFGKSKAESSAIALRLCSTQSVPNDFKRVQCAHGVGHGLLNMSAYDLDYTIGTCERLDATVSEACTGGAYMELMLSQYNSADRHLKHDDLIYPCNVAKPSHKQVCYAMVATRIYGIENRDYTKTANECRKSEPAWIGACFQSIGRIAVNEAGVDVTKPIGVCSQWSDYEADCLGAAASEFVYHFPEHAYGAKMCQLAKASLRGRCFADYGLVMRSLAQDPQRILQTCRANAAGHVAACLGTDPRAQPSGSRQFGAGSQELAPGVPTGA